MFSFGWSEIALTFIIVIIVIGPKEIPNLLKNVSKISKVIKKVSREFKTSLNEISNETELKDVKNTLNEIKNIKKDINPVNEIKEEISSIKDNTKIFEKEINDLKNLENKK